MHRYMEKALVWYVSRSLEVSILLTVVLVLAYAFVFERDETGRPNINVTDPLVAVFILLQLFQLLFIVISSYHLIQKVKDKTKITVGFLLKSYLSTVLSFAGVYTLLFAALGASFSGIIVDVDDEGVLVYSPVEQTASFLYFSITTMTSVGFGDIYPSHIYAYLAVNFQQLVSVMYTTVVFSLGLDHFSETQEVEQKKKEKQTEYFQKYFPSLFRNNKITPTAMASGTSQKKELSIMRLVLIENCLAVTFTIQVVVVFVLTFTDSAAFSDVNVTSAAGVSVMIVFQTLQMLFVLVTSARLVKDIQGRTVTAWFLAKTYIATCISFAGVYALILLVEPGSFRGAVSEEEPEPEPYRLFIRFFYFSITTMTTTGYGEISPYHWYAWFVVNLEQLASVMYTTVVFSLGLAHFSEPHMAQVTGGKPLPGAPGHESSEDGMSSGSDEGSGGQKLTHSQKKMPTPPRRPPGGGGGIRKDDEILTDGSGSDYDYYTDSEDDGGVR